MSCDPPPSEIRQSISLTYYSKITWYLRYLISYWISLYRQDSRHVGSEAYSRLYDIYICRGKTLCTSHKDAVERVWESQAALAHGQQHSSKTNASQDQTRNRTDGSKKKKRKKNYNDMNISGISLHIHPPHKPTRREVRRYKNKSKLESGKRAPKWPSAQAQKIHNTMTPCFPRRPGK